MITNKTEDVITKMTINRIEDVLTTALGKVTAERGMKIVRMDLETNAEEAEPITAGEGIIMEVETAVEEEVVEEITINIKKDQLTMHALIQILKLS